MQFFVKARLERHFVFDRSADALNYAYCLQVGMAFSMVYGAMLTKTNRISRIFHSASQSARRPSYISPKSQLIITAVLVSVQFAATLVWFVAAVPDAVRDTSAPQRNVVSFY